MGCLRYYRLEFGIWIDPMRSRVFRAVDLRFFGPRWQAELGANFISQLPFQSTECNLVVTPLAFENFELGEVLDVRNLRMLKSGDEILGPLLGRYIVRFVKCKDAKRGLLFDQLLVDLLKHLINNLKTSLGFGAQTVAQHPVLLR